MRASNLHYPLQKSYGAHYYVYDNQGNLTGQITPRGEEIKFDYDQLNRLERENLVYSPLLTNAQTAIIDLDYFFDNTVRSSSVLNNGVGNYGIGKLSMTIRKDPSHLGVETKRLYEYDKLGNVIKDYQATKVSNPTAFTRGYNKEVEYDILGRVIKVLNPNNYLIRNEYNNGLKFVKSYKKSRFDKTEISVISNIEYAANGFVSKLINPNGTTTINTYDPNDFYRLSSKLTTDVIGKNLQILNYEYDTENNVKKIIDNSDTNLKKVSIFTYDDLYRLIKASVTNTANQKDFEEIYKYSPSGNILFKTGQGIYQYEKTVNPDNLNVNPQAVRQIVDPDTSQMVKKFDYDKAGNLLRKEFGNSVSGHKTNPINEYKFLEDVGAKKFVDSINNQTAICDGDYCPKSANPGVKDKALLFDGNGDYLKVINSDIINPKEALSIEIWLKPEVNNNFASQVVITKQLAYEVTLLNNGALRLGITNNSGQRVVFNIGNAIKFDNWNHVVMTYDGAKIIGYVNGEKVGEQAQFGKISSNSYDLTIGGWRNSFSFKGQIDEVKMYEYALNREEILKSYNQVMSKLILDYGFNEVDPSTKFSDSSENNQEASCSSNTCPKAGVIGLNDEALSFDGVDDYLRVPNSSFINPTDEITLEAWINLEPNPDTGSQVIMTKQFAYELTVLNNGVLRPGITNENGQRVVFNISYPIKFYRWNHVVITYNGALIRAFVNGKLVGEKTQTGKILINNKDLTIGGINGAFLTKGKIDEIRIYGRALNDKEIKDSYEKTNAVNYLFNYRNELTEVESGTGTFNFIYDANSQRTFKLGGKKVNYYPFYGFEIENDGSREKTTYSLAGAQNSSVNEVWTISNNKLTGLLGNNQILPNTNGVFYNHSDHLGSNSLVTDKDSKVMQIADYYPFGSIRFEETDSSFTNDYLFTGKERDEEISLMYFGARYYDAEIGRWVSEDPIKVTEGRLVDPQGLNMYSYVVNRPMVMVDFLGLDSALIFYGNEYKEGRDKDAYKKKAEARRDELVAQDEARIKDGKEPLYKDGIKVINGSGPINWKKALSENKDISLIIYYGHASYKWGLLVDSVKDNPGKNMTIALPDVGLEEYYDKDNVYIGRDIYITELPNKNMTPDAQIYLFGCNTARGGKRSIANIFSIHFQSATMGIMGYTNFDGYHPYVDVLSFNDNIFNWRSIGFYWFNEEVLVQDKNSLNSFVPKINP
ncbi:hypothetical protein A2229_00230 [Candidatus Peregrinibacteria bacterium RIFOXYA2_FULL_33_7]|nr:MAG: hypothetical protein A2229_00230 [Candidatus Peregrinibacteria bacterium RIFOXYA2_FULL_33_7]